METQYICMENLGNVGLTYLKHIINLKDSVPCYIEISHVNLLFKKKNQKSMITPFLIISNTNHFSKYEITLNLSRTNTATGIKKRPKALTVT